jgi:hypothetical protein
MGRHGHGLVAAHRDASWAIGDWVIAGMGVQGNRALVEAQKIVRPEIDRLCVLVETCRRFPPGSRRASLRFAHHQTVAKLDQVTAAALLDRAEREGMTVAALRAAARIVVNPEPFGSIDDDPEDAAFRKLAQAWNRADKATRQMLVEQTEESGRRIIDL